MMYRTLIEISMDSCQMRGMLSAIEYDGELSATAYITLAVVLLLIVTGLSWCFYRAMKAKEQLPEPQSPDEIGD